MAREAMMRSQPMSSPVSSKMQAAPFSMSQSKQRPTAGLAVMPLVPSEPPHTVPTMSSSSAMGTGVCFASSARILRTMSRPALSVRVVPPDCWMTSRSTGRPLAAIVRAQLLAVEAFAAQRHQQHGADVRVRAQPLHHLERILVGITARKADEVHVVGCRTSAR